MSISHATDNPEVEQGELVDETDPIAATIRMQMLTEKDRADEYAKAAAYHRREAERFENLAMERRALQRRWATQLDLAVSETGDPVNDDGDVQTALVPRPRPALPFPVVRGWRRCNGCQAALRPATEEELNAAYAALDLPDVRRECPDCAIETAARRTPYPPAAPPVIPTDAA